jgi:ABC-type Mn2+/Zn2+ transport system permease subunit
MKLALWFGRIILVTIPGIATVGFLGLLIVELAERERFLETLGYLFISSVSFSVGAVVQSLVERNIRNRDK